MPPSVLSTLILQMSCRSKEVSILLKPKEENKPVDIESMDTCGDNQIYIPPIQELLAFSARPKKSTITVAENPPIPSTLIPSTYRSVTGASLKNARASPPYMPPKSSYTPIAIAPSRQAPGSSPKPHPSKASKEEVHVSPSSPSSYTPLKPPPAEFGSYEDMIYGAMYATQNGKHDPAHLGTF